MGTEGGKALSLPFFQGEGWGGVCFLACETSKAPPSQPPPWQGEELFEAFFFGIDLTYRPKMCIRDSIRSVPALSCRAIALSPHMTGTAPKLFHG